MTRHAFLIIAHDNFSVLEKLLSVLAHPRVEIYLHIDAKVRVIPPFDRNNPHLHIVKDRIDTRWGDISQIETEYTLLESAMQDGGYSYYHLISGTHFPLMPVDKILECFEGMAGNTIFHDLCTASKYQEQLKLRSYNLFTRHLGYGPAAVQRFSQIVNRVGHQIQSLLRIERNKQITFYKASNWASFTEDAVQMLFDKKAFVLRIFRHSFCGDEFFAPTVLMNSELKDKIISYEPYLKIEMGDANPRVLRNDDFETIIHSGCLFARKFNDANMDLVNRIINSYES